MEVCRPLRGLDSGDSIFSPGWKPGAIDLGPPNGGGDTSATLSHATERGHHPPKAVAAATALQNVFAIFVQAARTPKRAARRRTCGGCSLILPMRSCRAPIKSRRTPCVRTRTRTTAFEVSSKRRRGYPSETRVMRGLRIVHGDKELLEKLGRNDPCPCGSGRRFQEVLHALRPLRRLPARPLLSAERNRAGPSGPAHLFLVSRRRRHEIYSARLPAG